MALWEGRHVRYTCERLARRRRGRRVVASPIVSCLPGLAAHGVDQRRQRARNTKVFGVPPRPRPAPDARRSWPCRGGGPLSAVTHLERAWFMSPTPHA